MYHVKKATFTLLGIILVLTLAACGGSSESSSTSEGDGGSSGVQEMTIKISHVVAENTPKHQAALAMAKNIEENSDGKVKVQVYPNGQLFDDKTEVKNLQANNVQFIIPDMSKMVGMNPAFNVPSLPFMFSSNEAAYSFWDGEKGQEIFQSLESEGIIGLRMWPNGPKQITNTVRPIKAPEDLQGLKIRVQGGQVLASLFKTLDAGPLQLPFGQLYTALEQGTVDGQVNTFSNISTKKLGDVQKYITTNWGAARVDYAMLTNKEFWEGLNEETKKIVQAGIDHGTEVARSKAEQLNQEAFKKIKERGKMDIYELSAEERSVFQEALQPVYDEFREEIGADVIKAAKESSAE
ncbi:DctP family TRAP transporter solute-binding subunit [Halobacillus shinanisalinarum]|uniref:DctP family TRAP transporter solute-binding subunit n=1 Tax=Halobacillus shinanisalinarum TaxID=2932258 RepID=A0ABY4H3G8_9BACI|nr:DctP family TRAP transporter solute-binding subunit [Halobacillus shinanisalinarum]UOQ94899.1 DctP family TRAP transporter solute-binding subunit [Halobacillus shinanisalinarum]